MEARVRDCYRRYYAVDARGRHVGFGFLEYAVHRSSQDWDTVDDIHADLVGADVGIAL
jgi:hypothetical protein